MIRHYYALLALCIGVMIISSTHLQGQVDSIMGDTGSAQSGALTVSGGTSGAAFDSTTSTVELSINYISMPGTTDTNGQILFGGVPYLHTYGDGANVFFGEQAGNFTLDPDNAVQNVGIGGAALFALTEGNGNTAVGNASLPSVTTGNENVAIGAGAGNDLTTGTGNVFVGPYAGADFTTGNYNTLVGSGAGSAYTTNETNNVILGQAVGVTGESGVIRIGEGSGSQTACYIDGIYGSTVDFNSALPVYIDMWGTLGTITSSKKFKNNIQPIGNASSAIYDLEPVAFISISANATSDESKKVQFGLVAEDVEKVMPELVVEDKKGDPYAVKYYELPVLILNELCKLEARVAELEAIVAKGNTK